MIKKLSKTILFIIGLLIIFVTIYLLSAKILGKIEVEESLTQEPKNISCYIKSNGVHTDLVLPIKNETMDWDNFLDRSHAKFPQSSWKYVAFGWGDKGFYLNTPTWNDLTFGTAFKAGFGLSSTAMHVTYYNQPRKSERCVEIKLTQAQYKKMVNEIKQSFQTSNDSAMGLKPKLIETAANYGTSDCFYEAEGKYSLFKTCNVWTNNTLKVSGLKAAFWAPFSDEVMEIHKLKE